MNLLDALLICAVVFGICFLADKGFSRLFRSKPQHASGFSVKLNKRYALFGTLLLFLAAAAITTGVTGHWALILGGILTLAVGLCLVVYYLSFGIYYDEETFLVMSFGRKSKQYRYGQICSQQLFQTASGTVIELYLKDGKSIQLQSGMVGVYPFLDKAFAGWLRQKGKSLSDCPFHDPQNSIWFPDKEA